MASTPYAPPPAELLPETRPPRHWPRALAPLIVLTLNVATLGGLLQVLTFAVSEVPLIPFPNRDLILSVLLAMAAFPLSAATAWMLLLFRPGPRRRAVRIIRSSTVIAAAILTTISATVFLAPTPPQGCFGAMATLGEFLMAAALLVVTAVLTTANWLLSRR